MSTKKMPFTRQQLDDIITRHPTPFHMYLEKEMRENARHFMQTFSPIPGFREYFAVKATPNPYLVKILQKEGFGADCSSLPELLIAERVGMRGDDIMFSSNDTSAEEFRKARALNALINLDDITHFEFLKKHAGLPDTICFRYNPGTMQRGNAIIGKPQEAKFGVTHDQILDAYRMARDSGIRRFGIHTMLASNELNAGHFVEVAEMLFELIMELSGALGISFDFLNIGGGIGIPYKPADDRVSLASIAAGIRKKYDARIVKNNAHPLKLFMECGRMITGPYGYLVAKVRHIKKTYKNYAGLDASIADLMRPALYGAYHHITIPGKEDMPHTETYDLTGSLCENNDKLAIDRTLPALEPDDIVVFHDTGAHGHAMGFNYNGKLRSAELLLRENNEVVEIRRRETVDDYFATLDFEELKSFPV